jgi:ketosteroid isomerase-like protein
MAEESTTPDLVELMGEAFAAFSSSELDAMMSFYAPDAVFEGRVTGDRCVGRAAIRGFFADFVGTFEEYEVESHEIFDLGNGVCLLIVLQKGRPAGSTRDVRMRNAHVFELAEGMIVRHAAYTDIDEARTVAKQLAESRR